MSTKKKKGFYFKNLILQNESFLSDEHFHEQKGGSRSNLAREGKKRLRAFVATEVVQTIHHRVMALVGGAHLRLQIQLNTKTFQRKILEDESFSRFKRYSDFMSTYQNYLDSGEGLENNLRA
ncbi:hypothetical protein NPIL_510531 [Nephila pilipes]|uniref:Uncharacterized protein n=1 Tax=Nephila pilipes TaxID=299642 RepID=A0A8X6UBI3_NEPPI|nr:hypothetical protein NPIL_510531 [Nephila pilipes]